MLDERHDREQRFFDAATVARLADLAQRFARPCCLCTPTVALELRRRGHAAVTCLDEDERFAAALGASFERFDLERPHTPHPDREPPDLVLVDPPFFGVSLGQLRAAVDRVTRFDRRTALAVAWLERRPAPLERALRAYGVARTATALTYETVDPVARNAIVLYANAQSL